MSKIGNLLINVPESVSIQIDHQLITIKGKEGEIKLTVPKSLSMIFENKQLSVKRSSDEKKIRSWHGLFRQLIANAVSGVDKPWEKKLEVVGTGFNVKLQGEDLVFKLGYSHPVIFKKVTGIKFLVGDKNQFTVAGANKQQVGEIAQQIKMIKKPDAYKGKGIRYLGEKIKLKPSKKVKATGDGGTA